MVRAAPLRISRSGSRANVVCLDANVAVDEVNVPTHPKSATEIRERFARECFYLERLINDGTKGVIFSIAPWV